MPDGKSKMAHFRQLAKSLGGRPEDHAEIPPLPWQVIPYWLMFLQVSPMRPAGFSGALRIPPSEWISWAKLSGHELNSLQWELLRTMDAAFMDGLENGRENSKPANRSQANGNP